MSSELGDDDDSFIVLVVRMQSNRTDTTGFVFGQHLLLLFLICLLHPTGDLFFVHERQEDVFASPAAAGKSHVSSLHRASTCGIGRFD